MSCHYFIHIIVDTSYYKVAHKFCYTVIYENFFHNATPQYLSDKYVYNTSANLYLNMIFEVPDICFNRGDQTRTYSRTPHLQRPIVLSIFGLHIPQYCET